MTDIQPSDHASILRSKLAGLATETFTDNEGMSTDYANKIRQVFGSVSSDLGVLLHGQDIETIDSSQLNQFSEKVDELKFLLSKIS